MRNFTVQQRLCNIIHKFYFVWWKTRHLDSYIVSLCMFSLVHYFPQKRDTSGNMVTSVLSSHDHKLKNG